jgi:hypothetical protein
MANERRTRATKASWNRIVNISASPKTATKWIKKRSAESLLFFGAFLICTLSEIAPIWSREGKMMGRVG